MNIRSFLEKFWTKNGNGGVYHQSFDLLLVYQIARLRELLGINNTRFKNVAKSHERVARVLFAIFLNRLRLIANSTRRSAIFYLIKRFLCQKTSPNTHTYEETPTMYPTQNPFCNSNGILAIKALDNNCRDKLLIQISD